jgi:S-adenosylmethionine:tRNA ribosyltransferase-isomerase
MPTDISQFDYHLPNGLISQSPAEPREKGRLMSLSRKNNEIGHLHIRDLPTLLHPSDILVVNNTKVFKARLHGRLHNHRNDMVEVFLVRPLSDTVWHAIGKPWKKFIVGTAISIGPEFIATIESKNTDGTLTVSFKKSVTEVIALADRYGSIHMQKL